VVRELVMLNDRERPRRVVGREHRAVHVSPRRDTAPGPVDILVYGVPDSSPYAIWASVNPILTLISMGLGYLGGMIEAAGTPGCTVIMAAAVREAWDRVHHPSYPDVWERVLTQTRDPYEITNDEYAVFLATYSSLAN